MKCISFFFLANKTEKVLSHIMLTCPYNVNTLTPHFYIVKVGFTGVYIIFLFCSQMMKLFPLWFTGCFIVALGMIPLAESQLDQKLRYAQAMQTGADLYYGAGHDLYIISTGLRTRAVGQTAKGAAAVQKLLSGAKRARTTSKNYLTFRKDGGFETALADFNSVKPVLNKVHPRYINLKGPNTNYPMAGAVGDTRLILLQNGDRFSKGSPVLQIRPALDPLYTRIVYKTPEI